MADLLVSRTHSLGLAGARRAANEVAARLRADFDVEAAWQGDALVVAGHGVDGRLVATGDTVTVQAHLGLLARPFRKRLLREIEAELDRALSPTVPL